MNQQRLEIAINVMNRVKARGDRLNMRNWQEYVKDVDIIKDENQLHHCGMAACFGGWLAISPEWRESGGLLNQNGQPQYRDWYGTHAIAVWLDMVFEEACNLTHPLDFRDTNRLQQYEEITVDHVIKALEDLRE